jgi:YVTN family beta-propeller protein
MSMALAAIVCASLAAAPAWAQTGFYHFETPPVNPLAMTPDGTRLLACNTADNRLEVFALTPSGMLKAGSIPVGVDPVSVRAFSNTEAWVVNHVSDSVSIVDLTAMNVRATIATGDEPTDVVFAGTRQRAFVCVSQLNQIRVYNPVTLAQIGGPIAIEGEDPAGSRH